QMSLFNVGFFAPGLTDIGNHCDDCSTVIALPFGYRFYGSLFTSIAVSSNGTASFLSTNAPPNNVCLPDTVGFPSGYTIYAYWADQFTDNNILGTSGLGIFTSISGSPPNRTFNIEWRTREWLFFNTTISYELRLYEGQSRFDVIYNPGTPINNFGGTEGVQ